MAKKTARSLRNHLFLFDPEYPVRKGYVARLFLDQSHPDVLKEIKTIVQTAEPNKTLNEENLSANLHRFKELLADKYSTCEWPALVRFFLEPFPIAFNNFPILLDHVQPILKSEPTSKTPVKSETLCTSSTPAEEPESTELSFTPPDQTSTPVKSFTSESSPRKVERALFTSVELQGGNLTAFEENSQLQSQLDVLNMPVYEREKQWKISFQRLHETMKKKSKAAYIWKGKYAMLKKTTKTTRRKWKMLQILEDKARTLEDELCKAQVEIVRLNEVIEHLNNKLKKTQL